MRDVEFVLFDRIIHPEFFETLSSREVHRDGYCLSVRMTPAGHVLQFTSKQASIVEMIAAHDAELPDRHKHREKVKGTSTRKAKIGNVSYYISMHEEFLPDEQFHSVVADYQKDGAHKGMIFQYSPRNRLCHPPLGLVIIELVQSGLSISAFHTYPEELAIIKTQSLLEFS